jgi:hypothetical protein
MVCIYLFLHSILSLPSPIHLHLECGDFCRATASRLKLQQAVYILYARIRHTWLVGCIQVLWSHEWTSAFLLHWHSLHCTFYCTSAECSVPDSACAVSQVWGWLSPPVMAMKVSVTSGNWHMYSRQYCSYTKHCKCYITSSVYMEEEQCLTALRSKLLTDAVD